MFTTLSKRIVTFLLLILSVSTVSAQHYRGFIDAYGLVRIQDGTPTGGNVDDYNGGILGIGGTTSHGLQFNKLFIGLGAGYYFIGPQHNIPAFAEARWDFFGTRGVNLFAGLKLGYTIALDPTSFYRQANDSNSEINASSFYFQPSVGLRIRTGRSHGFNISLNYIPIKQEGIKFNDFSGDTYTKIYSYTKGYLALGVGFDF